MAEPAKIVERIGATAMGQWVGELLDPDNLERIARYEMHLDRKLERTMCILKPKELQSG